MLEAIFKLIAFLIRIPFFCAGVFLWSFLCVPFIVGYALLVVPVLGFPYALLHGFFSNRSDILREDFEDVFRNIGNMLSGAFQPYYSMFYWLIGIKYRRW